ncbi:MAG: hypothetical protein LIR46_08075 [Bacteroidota bacterium]|nr:hypothetical protein [Bacteroidota bacterium]
MAVTIVLVIVIIGLVVLGLMYIASKNEVELKKLEREGEIAKKALSNDVVRVKIHDIDIPAPWRKYGEQLKYSDSEWSAYQQGFIDGVKKAKEEAKKIVQNTRQE